MDAARALAIIGMAMSHFGQGVSGPAPLVRLYGLPDGRASILFVLLAGLGVTLLASQRSPARRRIVWSRLGFRAALLLPAGLALQLLDHGALVILQQYALLFLVAASAVALSDRALLGGGLAIAMLAPLLYLGAWQWQPQWFTAQTAVITDPPLMIANDLLLTGAYPVLTWTAPLLFGMWLGRQDLRLPIVRWRIVILGAVVAVTAWGASRGLVAWLGVPETRPAWLQLVLDDPHSQMPLWLIGSMGSAAAVLGLALVAVDRWPRITWPLVAMGQLALSIYVAHLVALALWPGAFIRGDFSPAMMSVIRFSLVVAFASVLWRRFFSRGPLEAALRLPWSMRRSPKSSEGTGDRDAQTSSDPVA
ncbi:MAG: DUF418 domain-containing protein [Actinomycetota bacterium]